MGATYYIAHWISAPRENVTRLPTPPFPAKSAERQSSVPETSSAVRARDVGIGLSGLSVLTAKQSTTTTTTRIKPGRQALPCPALRRSSSSGLSYLSFFSILVLTTILQPRNQGRKLGGVFDLQPIVLLIRLHVPFPRRPSLLMISFSPSPFAVLLPAHRSAPAHSCPCHDSSPRASMDTGTRGHGSSPDLAISSAHRSSLP